MIGASDYLKVFVLSLEALHVLLQIRTKICLLMSHITVSIL